MGVNICACSTAPHHSRELCVRSRLVSVSISMSPKGDRMDVAANTCCTDVHVRVCVRGIRSPDQRQGNCTCMPVAKSGSVDYAMLRNTNIGVWTSGATCVKEREDR